jgi:hypothetical protein
MVHKMGEKLEIGSILEVLDSAGCGYTLDSFKIGPQQERAIQWIVARPFDGNLESDWLPAPIDLEDLPENHGLDIGLPNSVGLLAECPFQPTLCLGDHAVASGAGILPIQS